MLFMSVGLLKEELPPSLLKEERLRTMQALVEMCGMGLSLQGAVYLDDRSANKKTPVNPDPSIGTKTGQRLLVAETVIHKLLAINTRFLCKYLNICAGGLVAQEDYHASFQLFLVGLLLNTCNICCFYSSIQKFMHHHLLKPCNAHQHRMK